MMHPQAWAASNMQETTFKRDTKKAVPNEKHLLHDRIGKKQMWKEIQHWKKAVLFENAVLEMTELFYSRDARLFDQL